MRMVERRVFRSSEGVREKAGRAPTRGEGQYIKAQDS